MQGSSSHERAAERPPGLHLADAIFLAYWAIMAVVVVVFHDQVPSRWSVLASQLFVLGAGALLFSFARQLDPRLQIVSRILFVLTAIPITYSVMGKVVPFVNPFEQEATLLAIDEKIFGLNPQAWLEQWNYPPVVEVLQIVYASFFFLPVILFSVLLLERRYGDADQFLGALVLSLFGSYLFFLLVPAKSPYVYVQLPSGRELFTYSSDLDGVLVANKIRAALHAAEWVRQDCFPSGHTLVSLVTLIYAWRMARKTFWWLLPVITALIFSTVYLRYHYVIDLIAGAVMALLVVWGVPRWFAAWNRRHRVRF